MQFAVALPWWGYVLAFGAAGAVAWLTYARAALTLSPARRALLVGLRGATLVLLVAFLLKPVQVVPAPPARDRIVVLLVDTSRSMRLADTGTPRIEEARAVARDLEGRLSGDYRVEVHAFGESMTASAIDQLSATAQRSDLAGALTDAAERFRGQRVAGFVLLSDGGDTSGREVAVGQLAAPVFAVGFGLADGLRDREVLALTAGEPVLTNSSVDLSVSAVASGFGHEPVELRLSANGRPLEVRRVAPTADGAPLHEVFTVSPDRDSPTVYTVQIPAGPGEIAPENNARSVLVPPQGKRRRILVVEGAPGFEHTFLKRALAEDPGLEVDSVVRKGQNDQGRDTFFVQATASRAEALAGGFPSSRAALFTYDAVIFGNVEGDFFTRDQLALTAEFVASRGGGLLVLGARSFERAGLANTPLEEVLPLDLTDRGPSIARTSGTRGGANTLTLTDDGSIHPATRLSVSVDESRQRWADLPPLAASVDAGQPRPGAQVLAISHDGSGDERAVLAAQRFGQGRSVIFAGEAAWRWRMMLPSADTTYQTLWRQLTRWLGAGAREAVEILPLSVTLPGLTEDVSVSVRDEEFRGVRNAEVRLHVRGPDGQERTLSAALVDPQTGRYSVATRFEQTGVYRLSADVRRGGRPLATVHRPVLVGGADLEMSEPHLNESVLRRVTEASGGRYLSRGALSDIPALLAETRAEAPPLEVRDVWNNGWALLLIVGLLSAEWIVRRRVGFA